MQRGASGRYEITAAGRERVRAFVPAPLPPQPALGLGGPMQQAFESAVLSLGRLDGVSTLLPDEALFIYAYVRKEAVVSSQIEGTQSSLSDLMLLEIDEAPGAPLDDTREVLNYVAALHHGLGRLRADFPLSNRLIREIHAVPLSSGQGSSKTPGEFRRSQNWIGGTRPGNAVFVPPPHTAVPDCMSELERFLHADNDGLPVLLRAGIAHAQFETIHPFLDGNGRVGRLLITLLLCHAGVLREPLLYLSLHFKTHRSTYYRLLNEVRRTGDWEAWLGFFLEGVRSTAESAVSTAKRLAEMFRRNEIKITEVAGRRAGSTVRLHQALKRRPILSLPLAARETKLSYPAAASAMRVLVENGIAREITNRVRGRLFAYEDYLAILSEGVATDSGASTMWQVAADRGTDACGDAVCLGAEQRSDYLPQQRVAASNRVRRRCHRFSALWSLSRARSLICASGGARSTGWSGSTSASSRARGRSTPPRSAGWRTCSTGGRASAGKRRAV